MVMEPKYDGVPEVIKTPQTLIMTMDAVWVSFKKQHDNMEVVKGQKDGELILQMQLEIQSQQSQGPLWQ